MPGAAGLTQHTLLVSLCLALSPHLFSLVSDLDLIRPLRKGESPKVRLKHSKYLIISLVFKPLVLRRKQCNGERHLLAKKSILDLVSWVGLEVLQDLEDSFFVRC